MGECFPEGVGTTFTGRCCERSGDALGNCQTLRLPCSVHMGQLAARTNSSEFNTIGDAVEAAFLKGMSSSSRQSRRQTQGLLPPPKPAQSATTGQVAGVQPPPGTRRLSAAAQGGYYLAGNDDPDSVFERYFEACNPSDCFYMLYDHPGGPALFIIVSGLIGGLVSAGRGMGISFLTLYKFLFGRPYKTKVEPFEPTPVNKEVS